MLLMISVRVAQCCLKFVFSSLCFQCLICVCSVCVVFLRGSRYPLFDSDVAD